jgi:hypothetical protein
MTQKLMEMLDLPNGDRIIPEVLIARIDKMNDIYDLVGPLGAARVNQMVLEERAQRITTEPSGVYVDDYEVFDYDDN